MNQLLTEVENYVSNLLRKELLHTFVYHNLGHTQRVVKYTQELIDNEQINENDAENLLIAAWFHDTGYINGTDNHEEQSVTISSDFLKSKNTSLEKISAVSKIILATKMGYEPENLVEQIIRDADCAHFGDKNFIEISELLRHELEQISDKLFTDSQWTQENISFLTKEHQFYSNYAINTWQNGKDRNLVSLFKIQKKLQQEDQKNTAKNEALALKKKKAKLPERGIDTLFRVTLRNHISLSDIADTKANILLSVNAIIISLVLSNLIPKLDNPSNHYLIYPTVIFTIFTVTTMILSVIATRPNVTSGKFTKEDVVNKKVNLLFFGNFHKMKLDEFEWAIKELMNDKDYLYNSMTKDLYFLGLVLNRKYKILRITYTIFMIGIIISVISFYIAFQYAGIKN
ncbi:Pycsar system effector family protein [Mariniflexile gromovii]|uniref:HD domain-containing protein n=1 Tax=Mariniflexile gromovii TaxID=362523 RepID=A0ABS4BUN0_9FLAO|nr:Pycsar system effector family protein [Mariniflexile gromovii]MBP0904291.1 HD domain-containing protein [Mariniflexile gromovii]